MKSCVKYIVFTLVAIITACNNDIDQPEFEAPDYLYFPLYKGLEWIDSIVQIHIDAPIGLNDTSRIVTKTIVDSVEAIAEFDTNFYCTTYKYDTASQSWDFQNRFWFNRTRTKLIEHNDNISMLRLVYPLNIGTEWNPYVYTVNSDTALRNTVTSIDQPATLNSHSYDSTMTVLHQDDSTLIYVYRQKSIYVRNLGKVRYEQTSILSDDPNYDYTLPIEERIKIGNFTTLKRNYTTK